ncbi:NAD-binding Rossmann fold oxidoreductase [Cryptococcus deuterogattii 99/473]|uniref:Unplaced genomic scaffold supercont1.13, whole genome shotgun sequence n=1 Tax=Cryptococcus deuterogattii Ram5 TaxID=1296110 RepID=A0A0D0V227_9TREE|nr:NAD-binding Rossmann fold oxidoreductase [Cryptococcus deuterogattii LA55]KIR36612.1 NAD-binding Rossmann fold oxidoreductase [Cryptococcus deuterogattii MMRL2647]KIR39015.1 NAD-binding Rossmann fold oxidoreductase [Cryptococcus deuterogattii Ram5]KIR95985.1 NAD-binding Rossmann fold oxidoreductase [Cryptococcus deuterogattii CBS 10090]KIY58928.1 NAD-binding Rossmann fold oxidoreductase [Cryptococcus deuterogattii 99/473]
MPINVALLGGGIFAVDAHLPALAKLGTLASLKAVWSRSESSSTKAAEAWKSLTGQQVTRYSEDGSDDLENLLSRKDIDAVIIALPILSQANVIARALQAGKHVLSEKPVAKDVATAAKMLQDYQENFQAQGLVWRVAENWEVEPAHIFAAQALKAGRIGNLNTFSISSVLFVDNENNKYFETEWRKKPQHQGGYLLDAGVHNAGVLRTVLPSPITHVSAHTALNNEHLPPYDWLSVITRSEPSNIHGQMLIDYGARGREPVWELRLTGSDGEIYSEDVNDNGVDSIKVQVRSGKFGRTNTEVKIFPKTGVYEEQRRFFEAIAGKPDEYGSVQGALNDVALIQVALTSNGNEVALNTMK